jgi:hypothetical protein
MKVKNYKYAIIIFLGLVLAFVISLQFRKEPMENNKPPTTYSSNNYDVIYHDTAEDIQAQDSVSKIQPDNIVIIDATGNKKTISRNKTQGSITYNDPASYKYGLSSYVPSYEESILLSKTFGVYPKTFNVPSNIPSTPAPSSKPETEFEKSVKSDMDTQQKERDKIKAELDNQEFIDVSKKNGKPPPPSKRK